MVTFKFISRKERANAVMLRITADRKTSELAMGFSVDSDTLQEILRGTASRRMAEFRDIIVFFQRIAEDVNMTLVSEGKADSVSASEFRDMVKDESLLRRGIRPKEKSGNFIAFYRARMNAKTNSGYKASIEYTLSKILDFCNDAESGCGMDPEQLTFEDISLKWLNGFDEWLIRKGAAKNSRNIHFKNIRTVINRAIDEELTGNYPFRRFKIRAEETRKRSLTVEDLRRLFDYPCEEYQRYYIDMFKLAFMFIGINAIDLFNIERIENGRIEYRRAKTHRLYSVRVEPEAMEIIERWRGEKKLLSMADRWRDHKDFTKNINIALKKIGDVRIVGRGGKKEIVPEWPDLTLYWTRHTWATIAYSIDIPKDVISQALGHSSGLSVTEIYINRDQKKVDEANRRVIDWVLYGKS